MTHIRIGDVSPRASFVASGGETDFPFTFPILDSADLYVAVNEVTITTGFTVIGGMETDGQGLAVDAKIVFDLPCAMNDRITIWRKTVVVRTTDYGVVYDIVPDALNSDLDRLTCYAQEALDSAGRALCLPPQDGDMSIGCLPTAAERADKVLAFNANGDPIASNLTLAELESQASTAASYAATIATTAETVAADKAAAEVAKLGAETARDQAEAAVQTVRVSSNDTTPGTLEEKLTVGSGLSLTTQNEGGNEVRNISLSSGTAGKVLGFDAAGGMSELTVPRKLTNTVSATAVALIDYSWGSGNEFTQVRIPFTFNQQQTGSYLYVQFAFAGGPTSGAQVYSWAGRYSSVFKVSGTVWDDAIRCDTAGQGTALGAWQSGEVVINMNESSWGNHRGGFISFVGHANGNLSAAYARDNVWSFLLNNTAEITGIRLGMSYGTADYRLAAYGVE